MKIKFLLAAAIPLLLLAACDEDDAGGGGGEETSSVPIAFTASIQPETVTRITVNNGWTGLADNKMAISVEGTVKAYVVSDIGDVTSSDPFFWEDKESVTVDAWYPYNNGVKPETITVSADQSVAENYQNSDYLEVNGATVTPKKAALIFTHRTAKLVCTLSLDYGQIETARVILHGLTGVNEGTSIMATKHHRALLVPQTIPAGTEFIEVIYNESSRYVYTLEQDLNLEKACQYQADIRILSKGGKIEVVFSKLSSWISDNEVPDSSSPEAKPDGDHSGNWNGNGDETSDGNSPETDSGSDNGDWTGNGSESSDGNSPEAGTEGGNSNWTGNGSESSNGNSPEAGAEGGDGNWTGSSSESSNGSSPEVGPNGGNGSWTGGNESASGSTPEGSVDGSSNWTGSNESASGSTPEGSVNGSSNWTGSNESALGSTPEGSVNGSGTWTGNNESASGSTPEGSVNGSGTWTGSNESASGSTPEGSVDGNGTWTGGNNETVTGTDTNPDVTP